MGFTKWIQTSPNWKIVPTSVIFGERSEKSSDEDVHLTPSQKLGVIPQKQYIEKTGAQVVKNRLGTDNMKRVLPGDFISHLRSFQGGLEHSTVPGKVSNAYTVLKPRREIEGKYYSYLFKSSRFIEGLANFTDQLRDGQTINFSRLALFSLPLPPLPAQRAIADYLDRETAELDDMRTDLDKMERLMTERRQAIKAKYFESSTSYTAVKVKYVATINTGSGDTQDAIEDGQYPFYVRSDTVLSSNQWEFNGPAVLTAGDGAGVGKIFHYAEGKFKVHQRVYCIHGFRDVDPMYFFHAFSYLLPKEVLYGGASSTVPSLRMHMLEDLQIPLPPLAEQRRIAGEINRETSEINLMLEDIKKLRNLLAERRAAVISAAVTGQIDIPASPTTKDESHA
ncbi:MULTISPECIES: restriction endonuclease subunit S [Corynebacterium]|uniref:restriction endonuclease subunit S n=1 Tax=Corynebacterium TaxID=1716 RepID=UPI00254398F2|nr:restriction endonuclease subunit S [Corynebacterium accolens]MDK4267850.1 restriction endonuclease subunit S [Corynebacterium accolens]MDK4309980.1 restriction endonuclease subunit S [Corynebacterium accolens]